MKNVSPIIVIGMHRSGTGLLADSLRQLGVFMGIHRDVHHEAEFFKNINQHLFRLAHAAWDYPEPVKCLLSNQQLHSKISGYLKRKMNSLSAIIDYWGIIEFCENYVYSKNIWGWKDPRNSYTLAMWLDIFPNARVIHIYRNGIDVAVSLRRREWNRKDKLDNSLLSCRCMNLVGAFNLWTEYINQCLSIKNSLPEEQILQIRYESFLKNPEKIIYCISDFVGIESRKAFMAQWTKKINPSKAYAFREVPELLEFYRLKRDHPLMRRLGYDRLGI